MKKSFGLFLLLLLFLVLPGKVFAASIEYIESPSSTSFTQSDEITFKIRLSINASNDTNYYLRGVFFKKGSSNYCGYTWNGGSFFNGPYSTNESWKQFLKVTIQENTWEGEVKAKIDNDDSGCKDSGEYGFKIERFTETGSGTFDAQDEQLLIFTIPTPTPTRIPTSTPTPTLKPTSTSKPVSNPTKSLPTPFKSSAYTSPTVSLKTSASSSDSSNDTENLSSNSQVLGASNEVTKSPSVENVDKNNSKSQIGKIIIIIGGALLTFSFGILLYKKYRKEKAENLEEV